MHDDRVSLLQKTELFGRLKTGVLTTIASKMVERNVETNGILFVAGEPASGLYIIAEGGVRAFRSGLDGREQTIHVERAVTTIAEVPVFDDGCFPSTVAAEMPTKVFFIAKEDIRRISISHPELPLAAAKLLAGRLRKCAELLEIVALREVGQRIAMLFIEEARAKCKSNEHMAHFEQTLTHSQLAARIGTVREVVSRSLSRMQADGLVTIKGKIVTIPDIDALKHYSEG